MDCKRLSKKYCNDKCKQLAYLKRSNVTLSNSVIEITTNTQAVNNKEREIQKLLNEISICVLKLQELQKKQSNKNETQKLCVPVSFSIQKYTHEKK